MTEKFEEVFFKEQTGIEARFRNRQYFIKNEEVSVITDWFEEILKKLKKNGGLILTDLQNLTRLIETFEGVKENLIDSREILRMVYDGIKNA